MISGNPLKGRCHGISRIPDNSCKSPKVSHKLFIRVAGIFLITAFVCISGVSGATWGTGQFAISCNVDNAEVFFDDTFQGFISGGQLTVAVPTSGYDMRYSSIEVRKTGYVTYSGNLEPYPETGQIVPINVMLQNVSGTIQTASTAMPLPLVPYFAIVGIVTAMVLFVFVRNK
ncbi:MAG: hypothetical protein WC342_08205 [Methanoregula sp.]|jgi:hypothetical protein